MKNPHEKNGDIELMDAREKSIKALKNLSIDERLRVVGEMMDAIAEIKISIFMRAMGCDRETAINVLRERLMRLQETHR